jgi:hypothetical protein
MQPNHVIAAFGAFLILMSILGLVLVDSEEPGERRVKDDYEKYRLVFFLDNDQESSSGNTGDGQSGDGRVLVQPSNVTSATVILTWQDNKPGLGFVAPDADVTLDVLAPNGAGFSGSGSNGGSGISIPVTFFSAPAETDIEAKSQDDAKNKAAKEYPANNNGTGEWVVEVTVERNWALGNLIQGDISWTCTIEFDYYVVEVTPLETEEKEGSTYQGNVVMRMGAVD